MKSRRQNTKALVRLSVIRPIVLFSFLNLTVGSGVAFAETNDIARAAVSQDVPTQSDNALKLAIGDRLKIRFFERISTRAASGPAQQSQNYVERADLAGEYVVQGSGAISLPVIGDSHLAESSITAAQANLEEIYKAQFGRETKVNISIVSRQPIYIMGSVARPGTYDFVPGLTVLHVIANSGGTRKGDQVSWETFEAVREKQRMKQAIIQQKKALAEISVLKAEREGSDKPVAEGALLELAGVEGAAALMEQFQSQRRLMTKSLQQQIGVLDSTITAATEELSANSLRIADLQAVVDTRTRRLDILEEFKNRGASNEFNKLLALTELNEVKGRLNEAIGIKAQIASRKTQAEREKDKILIEARLQLERDLAAAEERNSAARLDASASSEILRMSSDQLIGSQEDLDDFAVTVVRRTTRGMIETKATSSSELLPGDLIKIIRRDTNSLKARIEDPVERQHDRSSSADTPKGAFLASR